MAATGIALASWLRRPEPVDVVLPVPVATPPTKLITDATAATGNQEFPQAVAQFRETIERKPDYALAHYNLGHGLYSMNAREELVQAFESAVKLRPGLAAAHVNRGKSLAELGRTNEAIEHLRTTAKIEPDDPEARLLLKKLEGE